jgi:hypothetical protein
MYGLRRAFVAPAKTAASFAATVLSAMREVLHRRPGLATRNRRTSEG